MNTPRWLLGIAIALGLMFVVVSILAFAHAYAHVVDGARCFATFRSAQWPKWIGCAMGAHENLAGGLIGLGGAIFAAWVAYSGAQDQLRSMHSQARESARLRIEEKLNETASAIAALKLAKAYLEDVAAKFPPESSDESYVGFDFEHRLKELHYKARIYLSESAASAPHGFGRTITTLMWRLERLGETLVARPPGQLRDAGLQDEIRLTVEAIRRLAIEIGSFLPSLDVQHRNLVAQVRNLTAD